MNGKTLRKLEEVSERTATKFGEIVSGGKSKTRNIVPFIRWTLRLPIDVSLTSRTPKVGRFVVFDRREKTIGIITKVYKHDDVVTKFDISSFHGNEPYEWTGYLHADGKYECEPTHNLGDTETEGHFPYLFANCVRRFVPDFQPDVPGFKEVLKEYITHFE
jgi:hypothetical protein